MLLVLGETMQVDRQRNAAWYKEKAMLAEAQEAGQILDEEQLAFSSDPRVLDGSVELFNNHSKQCCFST
ncbi:hypothetical protein Tco_1351975 [Tanacetum coccineum]